MNQFLDETVYLLDRIDKRPDTPKRTYRQIIAKSDRLRLAEQMIKQASLPTIDKTTGKATIERTAPGGHGQLGSMALQDALTIKLPQGKVLIRAIYNGDGPNNFPDQYIVGYMAKHRLPIIMISTTKTAIDKKGGQIGIQRLANGKEKTQMCELAQAKAAGQEDLFAAIGLPSEDESTYGQSNTQYFNTNIALINYTVLAPFLRELKQIIGPEKFAEIVTPDLIENEKEQSGKEFIQLEGAMGSALLNLNGFIQTTDDKKVKGLLKEHKLEKLLYIVNIDPQRRNQFFT